MDQQTVKLVFILVLLVCSAVVLFTCICKMVHLVALSMLETRLAELEQQLPQPERTDFLLKLDPLQRTSLRRLSVFAGFKQQRSINEVVKAFRAWLTAHFATAATAQRDAEEADATEVVCRHHLCQTTSPSSEPESPPLPLPRPPSTSSSSSSASSPTTSSPSPSMLDEWNLHHVHKCWCGTAFTDEHVDCSHIDIAGEDTNSN
jgi:hypothetical protein